MKIEFNRPTKPAPTERCFDEIKTGILYRWKDNTTSVYLKLTEEGAYVRFDTSGSMFFGDRHSLMHNSRGFVPLTREESLTLRNS